MFSDLCKLAALTAVVATVGVFSTLVAATVGAYVGEEAVDLAKTAKKKVKDLLTPAEGTPASVNHRPIPGMPPVGAKPTTA